MNGRIITPQFDLRLGKKTARAHRVTLLDRYRMWKARKRWQARR